MPLQMFIVVAHLDLFSLYIPQTFLRTLRNAKAYPVF